MEDKKTLVLTAAVVVTAIFVIVGGMGFFFYLNFFKTPAQQPDPVDNNQVINTNTNDGILPFNPDRSTSTNGLDLNGLTEIEKEKYFISSFYQPNEIEYTASIPAYDLPINQAKEQVLNYRDLSRKIDVDSVLDEISKNGFAIITNPFLSVGTDWESNYRVIQENELPVFITSDSITGLYQNTLHIIYKEIEQEIFYHSLWNLLNNIFDDVDSRYQTRKRHFGVETDLITEANRIELGYLAVALKLLEPTAKQVEKTIGEDKIYFSPLEAEMYSIEIPSDLETDVEVELDLINSQNKNGFSDIFLFNRNYSKYKIPVHYASSEKLKNYFLAITWLNDTVFPLWNQENDCPSCLLEIQDHTINFLAGLYLTNDLAKNQQLKNQWANIYKSISFFKGLETDITYLHYKQALDEIFGPGYNLDEIFSASADEIRENIFQIQEKISSYTFILALHDAQKEKKNIGLRLLRNNYLLENKIFNELEGEKVGNYIFPEEEQTLPITACGIGRDKFYRCIPTALDLFSLIKNQTAEQIIAETHNDQFENYQQIFNNLSKQFDEFDERTWHDNAYLSLLSSLRHLESKNTDGLPSFMTTSAWTKKILNTSLASWVDFHREITLQKISVERDMGFKPNFSYGYIEPQPEFYNQLINNTKMIMDGFSGLRIISPTSVSYQRLEYLKSLLEQTNQITLKELKNEELSIEDYDFINNFHREIQTVIGDVKKENIQNKNFFSYTMSSEVSISQYVDGYKYIIIVYQDADGKLFFALGPIFEYTEAKNKKKTKANWQKELNL